MFGKKTEQKSYGNEENVADMSRKNALRAQQPKETESFPEGHTAFATDSSMATGQSAYMAAQPRAQMAQPKAQMQFEQGLGREKILAEAQGAGQVTTQVQQGEGRLLKEQLPTTKQMLVEETYKGDVRESERVVPGTVRESENVIPGGSAVYAKAELPANAARLPPGQRLVDTSKEQPIRTRLLAESQGDTIVKTTEITAPTTIKTKEILPERKVIKEIEVPLQGAATELPVQGQAFANTQTIPGQTAFIAGQQAGALQQSEVLAKQAHREEWLESQRVQQQQASSTTASTGAQLNIHNVEGELGSQRRF